MNTEQRFWLRFNVRRTISIKVSENVPSNGLILDWPARPLRVYFDKRFNESFDFLFQMRSGLDQR